MSDSPERIAGQLDTGTAPADEDLYLRTTRLLDFEHPSIQNLVREKGWAQLPERRRIGAVYTFVRDQIRFGYNATDDLPASRVLRDGYGQCNTKTTLLMALLRATSVPCRFHGAAIYKQLQKGVVKGVFYRLAPPEIVHTWAEVRIDGRWTRLEGVILDLEYLDGLRARLPAERGAFLGYAVGTENLSDPPIEWRETDTAIQTTGLSRDHGVYHDPDAFYTAVGPNLSGLRSWLYRNVVRRQMNRNVATIRSCPLPAVTPRA